MMSPLTRTRLLTLAAAITTATMTAAQAQQPAVQQPATSAATLPNGASSVNETFGDWTVDCRIVERRKQCLLSQAQGNKESGRRVYAIELNPAVGGKIEGTILMPFGLNLDAGAVLKLDDKDLGKGLRFSTCVPQGCLLPVNFPAAATDAMRKGTKLVVASLNLSSGEAVTFNVSLNGFGPAVARATELAK